jgi:hypothetical protein
LHPLQKPLQLGLLLFLPLCIAGTVIFLLLLLCLSLLLLNLLILLILLLRLLRFSFSPSTLKVLLQPHFPIMQQILPLFFAN